MEGLEGYFVITKDPNNEKSKELKDTLSASGLVNLVCTRTFNRVTGGVYKKATASAVTQLRNNQEEARAKRKAYHERPDVKERIKLYNQKPEVKERKRQERARRQKIMSLVPKEILEKVYKEENKMAD